MRKLIHTLPRIIETVGKWTSLLLGVCIMGSCSVFGFSNGGWPGWLFVFVGLLAAALLVGWVFAVARLNSEVRMIRAQLEQSRKPED